MAILIHEWPRALAYKLIDLFLDARSQSPGKSITGSEQIALVNADVWVCDIEFNTLRFVKEGTPWVPVYRAWIATLDGKYGVFRLPVLDSWFGYGIAIFGQSEIDAISSQPFSDDTYWSDDIGFDVGVALDDVLVSSVAQGDTEMVFNFGTYGNVLGEGQYFTIDSYLYIATRVYNDVATGRQYVNIKPPARAAITAGAANHDYFEWPPYLISHFTDDLSGRHPLDFGMFVAPRLSVEEVRER